MDFKNLRKKKGESEMQLDTKNNYSKQNGITLIALVVTIVVLLILAGVSVNALFGNSGIIEKAKEAQNAMNQAAKSDQEDINKYSDWINNQVNGTTGGSTETVSFDASTLTIGAALNAEKYGWKVSGYTVTTTEFTTGVWRLFYQDSEYTYLITDELVGSYNPSNYYSSYANGSKVSQVGQRLNSTISTLFTTNNQNENIKATAWLTDTEKWKDYANGNAVFAIASPTVELFTASYNATGQGNTITLGKGNYGYTHNTSGDWFSASANHGIYNKGVSSYWWLASPCNGSYTWYGMRVVGGGCFNEGEVDEHACPVRPVVCIPTSVFNSNYLSGLVDD